VRTETEHADRLALESWQQHGEAHYECWQDWWGTKWELLIRYVFKLKLEKSFTPAQRRQGQTQNSEKRYRKKKITDVHLGRLGWRGESKNMNLKSSAVNLIIPPCNTLFSVSPPDKTHLGRHETYLSRLRAQRDDRLLTWTAEIVSLVSSCVSAPPCDL